MKITVSDTAERQLRSGADFYERQSAGLGTYFLDALAADIESLHVHAGVHVVVFENYHRLLSRRFPYSVYYRVEAPAIVIYAVLDNRSNPDWIRNQLIPDAD